VLQSKTLLIFNFFNFDFSECFLELFPRKSEITYLLTPPFHSLTTLIAVIIAVCYE